MAMHHRYGLTRTIDPVTGTPAYETGDRAKVIWSPGRTPKGRLWKAYGADAAGAPDCFTARTFPTLREAAQYATGQAFAPTTRNTVRRG